MQFRPRYDGPPVIDVDAVVVDPSRAVIDQRARLAAALSDLSSRQWATASRCAGWSIQDVAEHLVSVNRFWVYSIAAGLRGEPTRFLESFDPVTVPAAIVEAARGEEPATTLEKLAASNSELATLLRSLSAGDWTKLAEAPPGHLALRAVCAHALWDAWIHERDVLLPLGLEQQIDPGEITPSLAYVAALAPAVHLNAGKVRKGSLAVQAHDPELSFTVQVGEQVTVVPESLAGAGAVVTGRAVDLLEGLSSRAPLPVVAEEDRWLVDGLQRAFRTADR